MTTPLGGPGRRGLLLGVPAVIGLVLALAACGGGSPSRGANTATGNAPPPLTVLTRETAGGTGDIFIAPAGGGYPAGPEIVTTAGKVVWFHRLPAGEIAADFRAQSYLGQPVLTWFQSAPPPAPTRLPEGRGAHPAPEAQVSPDGPSGTDYIYNDRYRQIASVRAGNGAANTFHEFLITPWNTALIVVDTTTTADLASMGGPADQRVIDGLVQEIDIKTGRVLFQWDSAAHVPYADSYTPRPSSPSTPWDWFHINAVHLDTDGNLLVSSRNTWAILRWTGTPVRSCGSSGASAVPRATGRPRPGPRPQREDLRLAARPRGRRRWRVHLLRRRIGRQLARLQPGGDGAARPRHPGGHPGPLGRPTGGPGRPAHGERATTPGGDLFVGWGSVPYISEFSPSGKLLFNAEFPTGVSTYRAYLLPWAELADRGPGSSGQSPRRADRTRIWPEPQWSQPPVRFRVSTGRVGHGSPARGRSCTPCASAGLVLDDRAHARCRGPPCRHISSAYRKPDTFWQHHGVLTGGMAYGGQRKQQLASPGYRGLQHHEAAPECATSLCAGTPEAGPCFEED